MVEPVSAVAEGFASPAACTHCGLPVPTALLNPGSPQQFCCGGCRQAHALITACDLGEFYRLRERPTGAVGEVGDYAAWDGEAFAAAHLRALGDQRSLALYVGGMHCAACVWLLERLPHLESGIAAARVRFGESRLDLVLSPGCPPSRAASLVARLGYRPAPLAEAGDAARREWRDLLLRLAVASASATAAMHLSYSLYAGELTRDLDRGGMLLFGLGACLISAPAVTWCAMPIHRSAWAALRRRAITVDLTASLAVVVGMAASVANLIAGSPEIYADAAAMFVALLLLGRIAVLTARRRAAVLAGGISPLLPLEAETGPAGATTRVPLVGLRLGDRVVVRSGGVVPCDGFVVEQTATVDASMLTGESRPVVADPGATVFAGTVCRSAQLVCTVTALSGDTRLGRILAQLDAAGARPNRLVRLADRALAWFTPLSFAIAVAVGALWWWHGGPAKGLGQAVAVILVTCPCALGLAAPLVQAVACARAARRGILVRDAEVLEVLGRRGGLRHLVLDKTGTVTEGRLQVVAVQAVAVPVKNGKAFDPATIAVIFAAEQRSQHPLALAICRHFAAQPVAAALITDWREIPGFGVECRTAAGTWRIGRPGFAWDAVAAATVARGRLDGDRAVSVVAVGCDGRPVALIELADPIRPGAAALVARAQAEGTRVHLLSGDDPAVALAVGLRLGIAAADIHGGLAPEVKAEHVHDLATDGTVAMVGDGLNDAPAMAAADVAIALSGGIEGALASCHAFVARGDPLEGVEGLIATARAARRRTGGIIAVSIAFNVAGIALAAAGVWGPWLCALAMPLSSLSAVALAVAPVRRSIFAGMTNHGD